MKLILDTDPGVDDAMAFYYAHACADIDLIALTAVFGNVCIEDATRNALWMVEDAGSAAKVYQGCGEPLEIPRNPAPVDIHGQTGTGNIVVPQPQIGSQAQSAPEYLVEAAKAAPGEITVCAVGPLTNIARALQLDPEFISNLHQLVIMGGALHAPGNVNEFAEANFWNDPHAANIVVNAKHEGRMVIVGLDVTDRIAFTPQDFDVLASASAKTGGFLKEIGEYYMRFYQSRSGQYLCSLHDPAAVIACHRPDLFTMESHTLCVTETGPELGALREIERDERRVGHVCVASKAQTIVSEYKRVTGLNP